MPIGILNINMKTSLKFKTAPQLVQSIDAYFSHIKGEYKLKTTKSTIETTSRKVWTRDPEQPTSSSLALFLGFDSMENFRIYEQKLRYIKPFNYARLRIEAAYEQLLFEKPTGAIFALKAMGWKEKPDIKTSATENKTLKVEITNTGPTPAGNEKDVKI